jgi:hypothetical protein
MNRSSEESTPPAATTSNKLLRSTILAFAAAVLILVCFVLPAEYGIDPLRVGSAIGLTEMGKIKMQLAKEEAAESGRNAAAVSNALTANASVGERSDSMIVNLESGETIEVKLAMLKGQRAQYSWQIDSGQVYYDLHGETLKLPRTAQHRYSEGELRSASGELVAQFDGVHGWYWENRMDYPIRIVVRARGRYQNMIEM